MDQPHQKKELEPWTPLVPQGNNGSLEVKDSSKSLQGESSEEVWVQKVHKRNEDEWGLNQQNKCPKYKAGDEEINVFQNSKIFNIVLNL